MAEHRAERTSGAESLSGSALQNTIGSFGIANLLGMQIMSAEGGVGRVSIQIDARLMHPQQIVHGGVIFTLADTAMSMALLSVIPPGTPFGTIEAKINYLRPVRTGELIAEGVIVHRGRSTAVMEATIYNRYEDQEVTVAKALGTFSIARSRDPEQKTD